MSGQPGRDPGSRAVRGLARRAGGSSLARSQRPARRGSRGGAPHESGGRREESARAKDGSWRLADGDGDVELQVQALSKEMDGSSMGVFQISPNRSEGEKQRVSVRGSGPEGPQHVFWPNP